MAQTTTNAGRTGTMTVTQWAAATVGAVFALVGVAGFIPGLTQNLDTLVWAGNASDAKLLGLFEVSILHNLVHLAFGVLGLAAARSRSWARSFLIWGGITYLALALYGMFIRLGSDANFIPVNTADNWLHVGLGAGMVALGLLTTTSARTEMRTAR